VYQFSKVPKGFELIDKNNSQTIKESKRSPKSTRSNCFKESENVLFSVWLVSLEEDPNLINAIIAKVNPNKNNVFAGMFSHEYGKCSSGFWTVTLKLTQSALGELE
jgi:hypothetical protein